MGKQINHVTHIETYFKVILIHIQFYYLVKTDANLHAEMGKLVFT